MRKSTRWLPAFLLLWAEAAWTHDIGVSPAWLEDLGGGGYALSVRSGPALGHLFPAPLLPGHCAPAGSDWIRQSHERKTFRFTCRGGLGPEDALDLPWRRDGVLLTATWLDGSSSQHLLRSQGNLIRVPLEVLHVPSCSWQQAAVRYLNLGIEHILMGLDHLAFVLGLLMVVRGVGLLIQTITAFTVAHSITLALVTLDVLTIPTRPVEAAIALSILFLAMEIVRERNGRPGLAHRFPWLVAFVFGLLHGMGFASALAGIGVPRGEIPVALVFFNLGVELGQLLFVFAVLALKRLAIFRPAATMAWARALPVYLLGGVSAYWAIDRTLAIVWQV